MKPPKQEFKRPRLKKSKFDSGTGETSIGFILRSFCMAIKSWFIRRKIKKADIHCWQSKSEPLSCSIVPKITWIGHASFLIQIGGVNILTDPVLQNASYFFPRLLKPGIDLDKLPNIDFVLVSHNHRDHMDEKSLLKLKEHNGTFFLVPKGDKLWFDSRSFARSRECTWWSRESFTIKNSASKDVTFRFLPASHWSQRGVFDRNRSLWGSWLIECAGYKIYFAGDTAYNSHFKEIAQEIPDIDIALLPIGPCEPREWIKHAHVDANEAVKAFIDLKANHFIPMHWGTFPLGAEHFEMPIVRLKKSWTSHADKLDGKKLHIIKAGQMVEFGVDLIKDKAAPKVNKIPKSQNQDLL